MGKAKGNIRNGALFIKGKREQSCQCIGRKPAVEISTVTNMPVHVTISVQTNVHDEKILGATLFATRCRCGKQNPGDQETMPSMWRMEGSKRIGVLSMIDARNSRSS